MTEREFEKKFLFSLAQKGIRAFPIETEGTIKGFPDVLILYEGFKYKLCELKVTHNKCIKFEPSQIGFYSKYKYLNIGVVVYINEIGGEVSLSKDDFILLKQGEKKGMVTRLSELRFKVEL